MRKFLYALALVTLFTSVAVHADSDAYYINMHGIEMTETEYHNLQELGFTETQIERMDYQTYVDNKDIEATLLSVTSQLVHVTTTIRNGIVTRHSEIVTEEEMNSAMLQNGLQPPVSPNFNGDFYDGMSEDVYRHIETYIVYIDDTTMRYKINMDWLQMPSVRSWDIMAIGIEQDKVQLVSSIIARQDWYTSTDSFDSESYMQKIESTGGTVMFKLPSGSITGLESYMYFNIGKKPNVGTISSLYAVGDYAHAISTISDEEDAFDYVSTSIAGIDVYSPYANSYDSMIEAVAAFFGTW